MYLVYSLSFKCYVRKLKHANYTKVKLFHTQQYYLQIESYTSNSLLLQLANRQIMMKNNKYSIYILVPVTSVTLTPAFTNNIIYLLNEETQIFTCTTDSIRPAAWIQWYIGERNISYLAQTQPRLDGNIVQSSSRLNFTGIDTDHEKHIYCNAVNFEGRPKVESNNISIYIVGKCGNHALNWIICVRSFCFVAGLLV